MDKGGFTWEGRLIEIQDILTYRTIILTSFIDTSPLTKLIIEKQGKDKLWARNMGLA